MTEEKQIAEIALANAKEKRIEALLISLKAWFSKENHQDDKECIRKDENGVEYTAESYSSTKKRVINDLLKALSLEINN